MPPAPKKSALADKLKSKGAKIKKEPVWKGPLKDGITQSLLSDFLVCRERFRLKTVEGYQPQDTFRVQIEYGNMWHVCEEFYRPELGNDDWVRELNNYTRKLIKKYPMQQEQIVRWYKICVMHFPIGVEYWSNHPDELGGETVLTETKFAVPYTLPSGAEVLLRGKWDKVKVVTKGENRGLWLQENKTHGELNRNEIQRRLLFDQQTMLYLTALLQDTGVEAIEEAKKEYPLRGVIYNVVKRPLSSGKGCIRQHQPSKSKPEGESEEEYLHRLEHEVIRKMIADETPEEPSFFARWNVYVDQEDVAKMIDRYYNPILEQLSQWWKWVSSPTGLADPFGSCSIKGVAPGIHWQTPYGFYNVLAEGGYGDVDNYLTTGDLAGLTKVTNLFPELTDDDAPPSE